jgi:hypothetical protein
VELEIEEEEPEILLPKPTVTKALKTFQILSDFTAAEQLDEVTPLLSQMRKHFVKHRMLNIQDCDNRLILSRNPIKHQFLLSLLK